MTRQRRCGHSHRGQTMTEYLIILPLLLLLVLGVIQFALIYQAKSSLNYATFMGARQGSLLNAKKSAIKQGLASGMTPFFMRTSSAPALDDLAKARLIAAIEVFNSKTTQVDILSPTQAAFNGFKSKEGDVYRIANDNLMFRASETLHDGMSIQDANLLKIRVTYCMKLVVPFVDRVIYSLSRGIAGIQNVTHVSYEATSATASSNPCPDADAYGAATRQKIDSVNGALPSGVSISENELNEAFGWLPARFPTIPVLNWTIGGMRIPITSEAIVRMQSPVTF